MTQDTIKKLHELEKNRDKWYQFAGHLYDKRNVCIKNDDNNIVCVINESDALFYDFMNYIKDFCLEKFEYYNNEIEKL